MRLVEIINQDNVMKSKSKIEYAMRQFFHLEPEDYEIVDELVNVPEKEVELRHDRDNLPVKFGVVKNDFICHKKSLITLEGSPQEVEGHFVCWGNKLSTLTGAPLKVKGGFDCTFNQLTSLEGSPREIGGSFSCSHNPITSLEGMPNSIGNEFLLVWISDYPLLKLLTIKNLKSFRFQYGEQYDNNDPVADIMNKYIGKGQRGMIQCAAELTKAGFKGNARL